MGKRPTQRPTTARRRRSNPRRRRSVPRRRRSVPRRRRSNPATPKECEPAEVKGETFYVWEPAPGNHCYHIVAGQVLEQDHTRKKQSKCNARDFKKDVIIGKGSGISTNYPGGDSRGCPGGKKRSATLHIKKSSSATSITAAVTEPKTCEYSITVTTPHCHTSTNKKPTKTPTQRPTTAAHRRRVVRRRRSVPRRRRSVPRRRRSNPATPAPNKKPTKAPAPRPTTAAHRRRVVRRRRSVPRRRRSNRA